MNTSKEILDSIELSRLLCEIELQIKNIECGDAHTQIGNMMNFPLKPKMDYSDLRKEAIKDLHGMLYKAFGLMCKITLKTNNKTLVSVVSKSCLQIIHLLSSSNLKIQKVPMVKPLADLFNEAKINLQKNSNASLISDMDKLSNTLFV